jgi:hypothetical protein
LNRVDIERIVRDEETVAFQPDSTYLVSYREFVAYFASLDEITRHHLIIGANFTYGWMPRTLRFRSHEFAPAAAILNDVKRGMPIREDELLLLRNLIDNSMVAVSKLLHFVDPHNYAIWDRRVYSYVNGSYSYYQLRKPRNYLAYLENCREIVVDTRFAPAHASISRKVGYRVTPMRALELVMYWHGGG